MENTLTVIQSVSSLWMNKNFKLRTSNCCYYPRLTYWKYQWRQGCCKKVLGSVARMRWRGEQSSSSEAPTSMLTNTAVKSTYSWIDILRYIYCVNTEFIHLRILQEGVKLIFRWDLGPNSLVINKDRVKIYRWKLF